MPLILILLIFMNVILITSVTRPLNSVSVFSVAERIGQTIKTIKSVREKIKGCYIVLVEGSHIDENEREVFQSLANEVYTTQVTRYDKSLGEAYLLCEYLSSSNFKILKEKGVSFLSKLSGRYYLNEGFDSTHLSKLYSSNEFCILEVEESHIKLKAYNTTFYKMGISHVDRFVAQLSNYTKKDEGLVDIEHSFHKYSIVPEGFCNLPKIHVSGYISGDGRFTEM